MKQWPSIYAILLVAGCAAPLPQSPPPGAPAAAQGAEPRVGSQWRYAVRDGFTSLPRGTVEYRVSAVQGDAVTVEVLNEGRESTEVYTRDGNWLSRPATNMQVFSYSPAYPAFSFPLTAGKTWKSRVTATDPADGRRFPVEIQGTVQGWERVRVPAGEFDTLKVRRGVFLDYWVTSVRGQSVIVETEWYAPALGQVVRRETNSQYLSYQHGRNSDGFVLARGGRDSSGGPRYIQDDWLVYELVSHSAR